jgi:hypothetical protein
MTDILIRNPMKYRQTVVWWVASIEMNILSHSSIKFWWMINYQAECCIIWEAFIVSTSYTYWISSILALIRRKNDLISIHCYKGIWNGGRIIYRASFWIRARWNIIFESFICHHSLIWNGITCWKFWSLISY